MMKKISVVTINFNTAHETKEFLASVKKIKTTDFIVEAIVVDNGSKDVLTLTKEEKKGVTLIRSEVNTGFTGGNNIGLREALKRNADFVLVINNDTLLDTRLITNLLSVLESNPKIGVTVPKIYFAKGHEFHKDRYRKDQLGKVFWYAGGFTDWAHVNGIHRGVDEVDQGQYENPESITFATGCCMLIKREVLGKVGLFDEKYFLYYEDADFTQRVLKAGYKIYYVPSAVLIHINAGSSGGAGSALQDYFMTRNQMLFGMAYAPIRTKIALLRQSIRLLFNGRPNQKKAIHDYYVGKFGKGTYFNK